MTRPVVINMAWQRRQDRALLAHGLLRADVALICEARDRDGDPSPLRDLLPDGWDTNQHWDTPDDPAKGATAVAWRTEVFPRATPYEPVLMSEAARKGPFRVRARYLAHVLLDTGGPDATRRVERWFAVHPPLWGTGQKGKFYERFNGWLERHPKARGGGDGNIGSRRRLAKRLGRPIAQVFRREVMFLTVAKGDRTVVWSSTHPGSDHPILHGHVTDRWGRR